MRQKTVIMLSVAIGCGLAASWLTSLYLPPPHGPKEAKEAVWVAREKVPAGTFVKEPEKLFVQKELPEGVAPRKAIRDPAELKDRTLRKSVSAETWVTTDDLYASDQEMLTAKIPPGMLGIGITVLPEDIAGGFVLPDTRVDILWSQKGQGPNQQEAKIILQNIFVLGVDTHASPPEDRQAMPSSTVTVAVKPGDAETLRAAGAMGRLSFGLRRPGDDGLHSTPGATLATILRPRRLGDFVKDSEAPKVKPAVRQEVQAPPATSAKPPAPAIKQAEPAAKTVTMLIYNSGEPTLHTFVEYEKDHWMLKSPSETGVWSEPTKLPKHR